MPIRKDGKEKMRKKGKKITRTRLSQPTHARTLLSSPQPSLIAIAVAVSLGSCLSQFSNKVVIIFQALPRIVSRLGQPWPTIIATRCVRYR